VDGGALVVHPVAGAVGGGARGPLVRIGHAPLLPY
jgi:hypothetical protein